jgi:aquaporin Z
MEMKEFFFYVIAQLLGATIGIGILYFVVMGKADFNHMFFSNGFGISSPNGSGLLEAGMIEVVLSAFVIRTFLAVTETKGSCACSSLMIGLSLSAAYFLAAPFTNASLNPARSFGPAVFEGGISLQQVWFFFIMPMLGGGLAALSYKLFGHK